MPVDNKEGMEFCGMGFGQNCDMHGLVDIVVSDVAPNRDSFGLDILV